MTKSEFWTPFEPPPKPRQRKLDRDDVKRGHALLLSCMDLRVIDETAWLMSELNLHNKYDHVAVAGSSLGVLTNTYETDGGQAAIPYFGQTFWKHVDLAIELHEIDRVIIVEHADCGAYQHFVRDNTLHSPAPIPGADNRPREVATPKTDAEIAQHEWYSEALKNAIRERYKKVYVPRNGVEESEGLSVEVYLVTPWDRLPRKRK